ncbi:MAG: substrate-binding domain-containing protein [Lachnospiraceae bacterium]|nr:substrate-binding domain-containing protein [Robinsoniella sp.]MDY3767498.1 substrate-binding domain-containing protein [Lachnospiraceae bacterium]
MKRTISYMVILSILFSLTLFFLVYDHGEVFDENAKKYICIANSGFYYWNSIREGIEAADRDQGSYTKWVEFERYDTEEQIRLLENTQYLDVDGVITVGEPYSAEFNQAIQKIVDRGIPVALIDTDSPESGRTYYVGTDNYQAGYLAAKVIADNTDGNADAAIIVSKLTYANQQERYQGFLDCLEKYENMRLVTIIEAEGDKLTMQDQLAAAFEEYPSISAIFCAESASSRRLEPLLENLRKTDLTIIGFDRSDFTLDFIKNDFYLGTIIQSSYDSGYQAVSCLNQHTPDSPRRTVYTNTTCVTKENFDEFFPDYGK